MHRRDIIVIGASSGGYGALKRLVRHLPGDLAASVLVILHTSPRSPGILPQILEKEGKLRAHHAQQGEPLRYGTIYVAPPDWHMLVRDRHIHLHRGPKENLQRPAINTTFRSVAKEFGARAIGVILSGQLDDGAAGLWEIQQQNGLAVLQDPIDAEFPSMPVSAMQHVKLDAKGTADELGSILGQLAGQPVSIQESPVSSVEDRMTPTGISCPECGGRLEATPPGKPLAYRCRVGHQFSPKAMLEEHSKRQEQTLWSAVVTLEEGADLVRQCAAVAQGEKNLRLLAEAQEREIQAEAIRRMISSRTELSLD